MKEPMTNVKVRLTGIDGNAFSIIGEVRSALKKAGHRELAKDFVQEAMSSGDYDHVLSLCSDYVHVS